MKKKILLMISASVAVLIALLHVLTDHHPNLFSSVVAFPFEQAADGLRLLSDTGSWGNGLALALWVGLSAIPVFFACRYKKGKETLAERASLFVLSGTLLLALYGMGNPLVFSPEALGGVNLFSKNIKQDFAISAWAMLVLFIVLRLIRLFKQGNKEQLFRYMRIILYVLCTVFSTLGAIALVNGVQSILEPQQLVLDKVFILIRLLEELIPCFLNIYIILRGLDLLEMTGKDQEEGILLAARRLSRLCCLALGITATITAAANILHILLMRWLSYTKLTMQIPVIDIAFTVTILLFARLIVENKKLRDDNSLFI